VPKCRWYLSRNSGYWHVDCLKVAAQAGLSPWITWVKEKLEERRNNES